MNNYPLSEIKNSKKNKTIAPDRVKEISTLIKERLKLFRLRGYRLTGTKIAEMAGVSNSTVSKLLNGKGEIEGSSLINILETLGMRVVLDEDLAENHRHISTAKSIVALTEEQYLKELAAIGQAVIEANYFLEAYEKKPKYPSIPTMRSIKNKLHAKVEPIEGSSI